MIGGSFQVFVSLGTDVHPFERLVSWIEEAAVVTQGRVAWDVQHGYTRAPCPPVTGQAFLERDALVAAMRRADLVISHGGPSTVAEARAAGRLPVVVPRRGSRGEHIDDHQHRFARHLVSGGLALAVDGMDDLVRLIDEVAADPSAAQVGDEVGEAGVAAARAFGELVRRR